MALIKCPECGKEISETAKVCPNCGYKIPRKTMEKETKITIIITILVIAFLAFIAIEIIEDPLYLYTDKEKREQTRQEIQNLQKEINQTKDYINKRNK